MDGSEVKTGAFDVGGEQVVWAMQRWEWLATRGCFGFHAIVDVPKRQGVEVYGRVTKAPDGELLATAAFDAGKVKSALAIRYVQMAMEQLKALVVEWASGDGPLTFEDAHRQARLDEIARLEADNKWHREALARNEEAIARAKEPLQLMPGAVGDEE